MTAEFDIDVSIVNDEWTKNLADAESVCRTAAVAAFRSVSPADIANAEASILLTDDAQVRDLNNTYRGKDQPTNVLSFASHDLKNAPECGPVMLGDVVIAFGVSSAEARNENKTLADHLSHLVVHGMLHLLGCDHESDGEAAQMETLEIRTLADLGVADPYISTEQNGPQ